MKAYLFWWLGLGDISRLIAKRTAKGRNPASVPSHVGNIIADGTGHRVWHAYADAGGWVEWTYAQLTAHIEARCKQVWHAEIFSGGDATWFAKRCELKEGDWPYDYHRLVAFFKWNRRRTPWRVTCSEGQANRCYPRVDFPKLCGLKPQAFDSLSPHDLMLAMGDKVRIGLPD